MSERYNTEHIDSDTTVTWFDCYDKVIFYWLQNGLKRSGKSIPMVWASPERAFGHMAEFLSKQYGRKYDEKAIPLPFGSVQRLDYTFDVPDRWRMVRVRKSKALGITGEQVAPQHSSPDDSCLIHAWEGYNWPVPVKLSYQLDIWTRNLWDLDFLTQQVILLFNLGDETWLVFNHREPFGERICPVTLERVANNSQLEAQEGEDRVLRRSFSFRVDGWVPKPSSTVKAVRKIDIELEVDEAPSTNE